jgi:hypothetical protein
VRLFWIQAAIDAANPGDTIDVAASAYNDQFLTINPPALTVMVVVRDAPLFRSHNSRLCQGSTPWLFPLHGSPDYARNAWRRRPGRPSRAMERVMRVDPPRWLLPAPPGAGVRHARRRTSKRRRHTARVVRPRLLPAALIVPLPVMVTGFWLADVSDTPVVMELEIVVPAIR